MPKYQIKGRNQQGKNKTVTLLAESESDAAEIAQAENPGFKFGQPEIIREQVHIKGPFIYRTFEVAAKQAGHTELSAKALFADYLKNKKVVLAGPIGMGNTPSFKFT